MTNQKDRIRKAAEDLEEIMEELGPYIRRPVVVEPTTRGRWVRGDLYEWTEQGREKEVQTHSN